MIQVNYYKKVCVMTDSEIEKLNSFIEKVFDVKNIVRISTYIDGSNVICEIEGLEETKTRILGTVIKHDIRGGENE